MIYRGALLLLGLFTFSAITFAGAGLSSVEKQKIKFLKSAIRTSGCQFERNGSIHTLSEALKHIEKKQNYYEDEIDSVEKFIELAASKSSFSGRPYHVICPNTGKVKSQVWLKQQLINFKIR